MFADPQVRSRDMTVEIAHPLSETVHLVASPMRLSATPVQYRRAPPLLGQHTAEVLNEMGLSAAEIEALRDRGAI